MSCTKGPSRLKTITRRNILLPLKVILLPQIGQLEGNSKWSTKDSKKTPRVCKELKRGTNKKFRRKDFKGGNDKNLLLLILYFLDFFLFDFLPLVIKRFI
jgi:hypothetical protein